MLASNWVRSSFHKLRSGMPFVTDEKRLTGDAKLSLVIQWCYQFGASMAAVFLNLYLWRLTKSLEINGWYFVIVFLTTPFAFLIAGKWAKKKNLMFVFRLGVIFSALFYLLVIIVQENVAEFFYVFAVLNGVLSAFYWTGFLVIMYDVSTEKNRIHYFAFNMIAFTSATLLGPALAGFIISQFEMLTGYVIIFACAFIMFVITAVISFKLKISISHHKSYYFHLMGLLLYKHRAFHKALLGFLLLGMFQGIIMLLPNILLFEVVQREDAVGYWGVVFSISAISAGLLLSRFASESHRLKYIFISSCGFVAASSLLFIDISVWTIIGFMLIQSFFNPIQGNTMSTYYYRLIAKLPLKGQLRIESLVLREFYVNTGRIVAILGIVFLADSVTAGWLPWVILGAAAMQFGLLPLIDKDA
jgi:YQGE family putative transporter